MLLFAFFNQIWKLGLLSLYLVTEEFVLVILFPIFPLALDEVYQLLFCDKK